MARLLKPPGSSGHNYQKNCNIHYFAADITAFKKGTERLLSPFFYDANDANRFHAPKPTSSTNIQTGTIIENEVKTYQPSPQPA